MDLVTLGSGLALAIIAIGTQIPRIMAGLKRDKLDNTVATTQMHMVDGIQQSYEKQIISLNERLVKMEARMAEMDTLIHGQAVKTTRLVVVVIQLRGLLRIDNIVVPAYIDEEIASLTKV